MAIDDKKRILKWINWFEKKWNAPDTYDLTTPLLEALQRWLDLSPPYYIYLKTIQALILEDETTSPRSTYKMPSDYQHVVIEHVKNQLQNLSQKPKRDYQQIKEELI